MLNRLIRHALLLTLTGVALAGCTIYHQPRYGADGVYFEQAHAGPRQIVVVDPMLYPYWSLDFFYYSRHYRPYHSLFFLHDPWWGLSRHHGSGGRVWSQPMVYASPSADQRLWLMQDSRTGSRPHLRSPPSNPGSEVQLRHRLAEDRATAASRRDSAPGRDQARSVARAEALRPAPSAASPGATQSPPGTASRQTPAAQAQARPQMPRSRDESLQRSVPRPIRHEDRPSAPSRSELLRERRDEP